MVYDVSHNVACVRVSVPNQTLADIQRGWTRIFIVDFSA